MRHWNKKFGLMMVFAFAGMPDIYADEQSGDFEYKSVSHTIKLESFRAGQHDPSGINDYYFTAIMRSLIISAAEQKLSFDKRKSKLVELGNFGELTLPSLTLWKPTTDTGAAAASATSPFELKVLGDEIRKLVANTMTEFNVNENAIEVHVELTLFEKARRYVFFGEDQKIATITYSPLPVAGLAARAPADQTLKMVDDKGTIVALKVHYDAALALAE